MAALAALIVAETAFANRNSELVLQKPNRPGIAIVACSAAGYIAWATMLQAHSFLWHCLWVAPNVVLLVLAFLIRRRQLDKQFPVFLVFTIVAAIEQLTLYAADVLPWVGPFTWWRVFWAGLLLEALVKFAVIGEIFGRVFGRYSSLAKLGKLLISGTGVVLVFLAAVAAAYTPRNNTYWIVSGAHLLEQTIYMIECGLILFLFIFTAYFKLRWSHFAFGIALGLSFSACVHLATWALAANGNFSGQYRVFLDFLKMAAYNVSVLIWSYYLLVPLPSTTTTQVSLPENNLAIWNRELERLLQQ